LNLLIDRVSIYEFHNRPSHGSPISKVILHSPKRSLDIETAINFISSGAAALSHGSILLPLKISTHRRTLWPFSAHFSTAR
jgi:hypothetical protein